MGLIPSFKVLDSLKKNKKTQISTLVQTSHWSLQGVPAARSPHGEAGKDSWCWALAPLTAGARTEVDTTCKMGLLLWKQ